MIVPMKKVSFLVHHTDYNQFLEQLQQLGLVDVVDKGIEPDKKTADAIAKLQQIQKAARFLKSKLSADSSFEAKKTTNFQSSEDILDAIAKLQSESEGLKHKIAATEKSIRQLEPWGNFSQDTINKLSEQGYHLHFFEVAERKFDENWRKDYYLEVIQQLEGQYYFVVIQKEGEPLQIDAEEVKAPERPVRDAINEKHSMQTRMEEINKLYASMAPNALPVLEKVQIELEDTISFDHVINNTSKIAEDKVMIVEGWIPASKLNDVEVFLNKMDVFHIVESPKKEEKVPILLNNGNFSKLFEPIGKLYSLPKYGELDLTPLFAPFFMLFFGFCLGDAGYGLLFLIGATAFKSKLGEALKPVLTLLQWLGGATIIFGIVSGTFFGMNLIEMVDNGKLQWLREARTYMLDSEKMFYFALVLGAIQIVYGMIIKAVNLYKQYSLHHAMATIGWIILIVGSIILYAVRTEHNDKMISILQYVVLGVSGIFILFMNNPGKNVFVNFGGGLWEVYSIVTGVMGDLLSYIRLFALGVSSAILGYVFNDLALQMSGDTPVVSQLVFVLIILIGHGLNIFMAALGAFVHPMRLTFVEFYKNAGFTGGGKAYNPFAHKTQESKSL